MSSCFSSPETMADVERVMSKADHRNAVRMHREIAHLLNGEPRSDTHLALASILYGYAATTKDPRRTIEAIACLADDFGAKKRGLDG